MECDAAIRCDTILAEGGSVPDRMFSTAVARLFAKPETRAWVAALATQRAELTIQLIAAARPDVRAMIAGIATPEPAPLSPLQAAMAKLGKRVDDG